MARPQGGGSGRAAHLVGPLRFHRAVRLFNGQARTGSRSRTLLEVRALLDLAVAVLEVPPVVFPGVLLRQHASGLEFLPFCEGHLDLIGRQGRTRALRPRVLRGPAPQATMDSDDG